MTYAKALFGAAAGGFIGATIWAVLSYLVHIEIGWIAWGVGVLAGFGAASAAGGRTGVGTGLIASVVSLVSILAGKAAAVHLAVGDYIHQERMSAGNITDEDLQACIADEIVREYDNRGVALEWPDEEEQWSDESASEEDVHVSESYPPEVWREMLQRWHGLSAGERDEMRASMHAETLVALDHARVPLEAIGFVASFGVVDGVFMFLAIGTAYRLGAGRQKAPGATSCEPEVLTVEEPRFAGLPSAPPPRDDGPPLQRPMTGG